MRQPVRIVAHRNRNGTLSIRLRVTLDGTTTDIASGVTVDAATWDKRRQRVTPSHPDHRTLNATIDNLADQLRDYTARHPSATSSQLRAAVQHPAAAIPHDSDDLFNVYDLFTSTESRRNNWTDGTRHNYDGLRSILVRFNPLLRLSTLDAATLDAMRPYMAIVDALKAESMTKFNDL